MYNYSEKVIKFKSKSLNVAFGMILCMLLCPVNIFSENLGSITFLSASSASLLTSADSVSTASEAGNRPVRPSRREISPIAILPDSFPANLPDDGIPMVEVDSIALSGDSLSISPVAEVGVKVYSFNPDPIRAVWMSALFPGLGQLYNRRYWKLPIVVGAFMGLGYATSWNNTMLRDYTRAYSDIMDNDPTSKSYMDFFAPTVKEEDLDKRWLTDLLRRRKNYYRRNRDLCIICMVGVYALAIIDAYVDASLSHFDISPDLSVDIAPTLIPNETRGKSSLPGLGFYWAFNF